MTERQLTKSNYLRRRRTREIDIDYERGHQYATEVLQALEDKFKVILEQSFRDTAPFNMGMREAIKTFREHIDAQRKLPQSPVVRDKSAE